MRSVTFLADSVASSGTIYKAGETHELEEHSAGHWLKRGIAVLAEPKKKAEAEPAVEVKETEASKGSKSPKK